MFLVLGVAAEGPRATLDLGASDLAAVAYLAVLVTAVAFVLWYSSVAMLGAGPAGLLAGIAPISAAVTGMALAGGVPGVAVWAGMAVVGVGLVAGLTRHAGPVRSTARGRRRLRRSIPRPQLPCDLGEAAPTPQRP